MVGWGSALHTPGGVPMGGGAPIPLVIGGGLRGVVVNAAAFFNCRASGRAARCSSRGGRYNRTIPLGVSIIPSIEPNSPQCRANIELVYIIYIIGS